MKVDFTSAFEEARVFGRNHQFAQAISRGENLLNLNDSGAFAPASYAVELHRFLSSQHAGTGDLAKATFHFDAAFWAAPEKAKFHHFNDLVRLYRLNGQGGKIRKAMDRVMGGLDRVATGKQTFVFALPKSAGSSLCSSIADALGTSHIASGFDILELPHQAASVLGPEIARRVGTREVIHQTHAMPWPENFDILNETAQSRFIVHVRDPRHAVLSYYYMGEQVHLHRLRMIMAVPNYNKLTKAQRCDAVFDIVFPTFIEWLRGWTDFADRSGGRALVTSFEEFARDGVGVVRRATAFLSGEAKDSSEIYRTHFRKGVTDEVDPLMSEERRETLFAQIPADLRERFGWTV